MGTPDWFMEIMEIIDKWGYHGNKKENTGITGGYNGVLVGYIYIIKYNKIYIYNIYIYIIANQYMTKMLKNVRSGSKKPS
jgi:hypothetical protein